MSISVETLALAKKNTKQVVEEAVTSVYKYRGSVETFEDLPTSGQKVGDVYNIEKEAGRNYAWDGNDWDALGIAENLGDVEFTGADSEIKTINEDFWDKNKVQEELDDVSNDIANVSNDLSNTSNALNNSINEVSNVANAAANTANNAMNLKVGKNIHGVTIYPATWSGDNISNLISDYPGIDSGDIILEITDFNKKAYINRTNIDGQHFGYSTIKLQTIHKDATTVPPSSEQYNHSYDVGDIWENTETNRIYLLTNVIRKGGGPYSYDYEWIDITATDLSNYYTKTQADSMRQVDRLAIEYAANTAENAYDAANAAHNSAYNANMNAGTAYSTATNAYNTANAAYNAANSASCAAWSANTNALSATNVANNALNQISNIANDLVNARNDITNAANQASCGISIATSANAVAAEGRNLANNALNDIANITNDVSNASNLAQAAYDAANSLAPAAWQEISNITTNAVTNSVTLPIDKEYDEYLITFNRPVAMDGSSPADSMTSTSGALTLSIGGANVIGGKASLYEKMDGTYTVENIVGNMYHATCYRNNLQGADTSYTENVVDINDVTNGGAVLATTVGSSANIASNVTITLYGKGVPTPEPDPWADYVKVNALDMVQTYNDGQYIGPFAFADFNPEESSYVFIQYQCPSIFDNKEIEEGEVVLNWNTVEPTLTESSIWSGDEQYVEKVSNNLVKTIANYQIMQDTLYNFIEISNLFSDLSKVTIMYKPISE